MKIEKEHATALKLVINQLKETPHGQFFLEFLEEICGRYAPNYDPKNETTIILAAGRHEVIQTIRNLDRLTVEQIVEHYRKEA